MRPLGDSAPLVKAGILPGVGLGGFVILGIHGVREDVPDVLPWGLGSVAFGALLVAACAALVRTVRREGVAAGVR